MIKPDTRQIAHRSKLSQISSQEKPNLKEILPSVDSDLTPICALRANDSGNDLILNIGSSTTTNPQTARKRSSSDVSFAGGTVNFPAVSGGNIIPSVGTNITLTVTNNNYIIALVELDSSNQLVISLGTENTVETSATIPARTLNNIAIGYVVLFNNAGTIANISDDKIVQYALADGLKQHENATSGVHGVTGDILGTTDTQTLSNKTFSNAIQYEAETVNASGSVFLSGSKSVVELTGAVDEIANIGVGGFKEFTLINKTGNAIKILNDNPLAAAPTRIFTGTGADFTLKADQSVKFLFSSESLVWYMNGASGSGSGSGFKNYIEESSSADVGLGNWTADALINLSIEETDEISGDNSYRYEFGNGNTESFGPRVPFTIDKIDLGMPLFVSLDIDATLATTFLDREDVVIFVRDTDNNEEMTVSGDKVVQMGIKQKLLCSFQSKTGVQNYEVGIKRNASTTVGLPNFTLRFNNGVVGPRTSVVYGVPATDMESYTPALYNLGLVSNESVYQRRVGDCLEVRGVLDIGTPVASAPAGIGLPGGLSLDISKAAGTGNGNMIMVGYVSRNAATTAQYQLYIDTTYPDRVLVGGMSGSTTGLTYVNGTNLFSAGQTISFFFTVPIAGWSSNAKMSSSFTNSEIYTKVTHPTLNAVVADVRVPFTTFQEDTIDAFDAVNNRINIFDSALYDISASGIAGGTTNENIIANIKVKFFNSAGIEKFEDELGASPSTGSTLATRRVSISGQFRLLAGDYVELQISSNIGGSGYTITDLSLSVAKRSNPQTIFSDENDVTILNRVVTANDATIAGLNIRSFTDIDGVNAVIDGDGFIPKQGRYKVTLANPIHIVNHSKMYLFNVTAGTYVSLDAFQNYQTAGGSVHVTSQSDVVVFNGTDKFQLIVWTESARFNGFGGTVIARGIDPSGARAITAQVILEKLS